MLIDYIFLFLCMTHLFLSYTMYYTLKVSRGESKWICAQMGACPFCQSASVEINQFVTEVGLEFRVALNWLFTIGFKWCEDRRKTISSELESRVAEGFICPTGLFSNFYRCTVSQLVSFSGLLPFPSPITSSEYSVGVPGDFLIFSMASVFSKFKFNKCTLLCNLSSPTSLTYDFVVTQLVLVVG